MGGPAPPQIISNDSTASTNDNMMSNNSSYNSMLMNNSGNNSSLNTSQAYDIPDNRGMTLGNKLLVGGMTALVGSQMFGGASTGGSFDNGNYQYRDLSFIPIFKLLPILENESFVKFFDIIRILLFVCGIYIVFEPLLTFVLNYFDPDAEKKQVLQVDSKNSKDFFVDQSDSEISNFDILRELVKLTGYNLGFVKYSLNEKLEHVTEFNKKSDQWFFKRLDQYKNIKLLEGSFKSIILNYVKSLSFEDRTLDTLLSDITIKFQFKRIILTKIIMLQLNPLLVKFLGLQKILDRLVLNLVKVNNMIKSAKNNNKKVKNSIKIDKDSENILNLISNDIEFIESDELFEKLMEILRLNNVKSANTNKSQTNGDSNENSNSGSSANADKSESNNTSDSTNFDDNYSSVREFLYNAVDDDLNVINLVCVIRAVQILKNYMIEYLTLITEHQFGNDKESEGEGDVESESEDIEENEEQEVINNETEDALLDEAEKTTIDATLSENISIQTETDPSKKEKKTVLNDIVKSSTHMLNSLNSKQMIIPDSCKKLIKCRAIFKSLLNPVDSNNINEAYSLILESAKKLIDYYDVLTLGDAEFFSDDEDNADEYISTLNIKNSVISKIVAHNATAQKFAAHGNSFELITYENRLSLTCAIILHYYSTRQFEKGRKLIKHLVMNNESNNNTSNPSPSKYNCLTLLSFISTFLTIMVILENDKSVLNGTAESDSEEKDKVSEDENSSEYSKELDEATYLNKTTLENNLAFMRLYIGSAHLLTSDQKSTPNSKINGHYLIGSDVTSLDIYLKREISNKLVNLAKELTGYESYN
ncbi:unnamed protein product [[Candida] boidinii]|nr:unnamed protein product [[Candida] boidinii]